jgi:hypothetical protein
VNSQSHALPIPAWTREIAIQKETLSSVIVRRGSKVNVVQLMPDPVLPSLVSMEELVKTKEMIIFVTVLLGMLELIVETMYIHVPWTTHAKMKVTVKKRVTDILNVIVLLALKENSVRKMFVHVPSETLARMGENVIIMVWISLASVLWTKIDKNVSLEKNVSKINDLVL